MNGNSHRNRRNSLPAGVAAFVKRTAWLSTFASLVLLAACRSSQTTPPQLGGGTIGPAPSSPAPGSPSAQTGSGSITWVTVRDAREQAFSISVPQGWKVVGGMFRYRIAYPRPTVDMTSPDGMTNVRVGDNTIPNYQNPNPNPYLPKVPNNFTPVDPYTSGQVFAQKYGLDRFGAMCQGIQVTSSQSSQPKYSQQVAGYVQATGGNANFSCTMNGQLMVGYVYAETMQVGANRMMPANWYETALGSSLAPAAQAQNASAILTYSTGSMVMNPDWAAWQNFLVAQATKINLITAAKTKQATAEMDAREAQWRQMMAGEVDDFNDILTGTTFGMDPATGQPVEIPTGNGGPEWMDGQNNVQSAAMQPGPAYQQVQPMSHQQ
jgi:hypothetical protein